MKNWQKRLTALILTVLMLAGSFTLPAYADRKSGNGQKIITEEKTEKKVNNANKDAAPKKIKIEGSKYVAKGKKIKLTVTVTPSNASKKMIWSSENSAIATVDSKGNVKGVKAGKTKITATSAVNKKIKKTFNIRVTEQAVKKVKIVGMPETMEVGQTASLKAGYEPIKAADSFTWKSSDPNVATVSAKGKVTAVGAGTAVITVTATDGSKKKDKATVTVGGPAPVSGKTYRALLIGEERHLGVNSYGQYCLDICTRNTGDMNNMASMLGRVSTPDGGKYKITSKKDANYDTIRSLIQSTFAETTENDVSLFFIATHGYSDGDGDLAMPFFGNDIAGVYDYLNDPHHALSFDVLANWLGTYVKGEVIVLLESCGAGSAIYSPYEAENSIPGAGDESGNTQLECADQNTVMKTAEFNPSSFVSDAIGAFSSRNHPISVNSTGDLRKNKYYVLAAARHHQDSWGSEMTHSNLFTNWLIDGASGYADADGNGMIMLTELFNYIDYRGRNEGDKQRVQRYPVGSQYEMFRIR